MRVYCWEKLLHGKTEVSTSYECGRYLEIMIWHLPQKQANKLNKSPVSFLKSLSTHFNTSDHMVWFWFSLLSDLNSADKNIRKLPVNIIYSLIFWIHLPRKITKVQWIKSYPESMAYCCNYLALWKLHIKTFWRVQAYRFFF